MRIMKWFFCMVAGIAMTAPQLAAQTATTDSTGLPGDNFSLQGALQMFKQASSPEDFEKRINTEGNSINNLDLNGDGEIDYVRVIDKSENDAHAFVLQVPVSETESQDIAVIELEKTGDTTAVVQIIGDEDIYGEEVIVEPDGGGDEDGAFINFSQDNNRGGPFWEEAPAARIIINVWLWPSVRFVYGPAYRPWASPWRWRSYPGWWRPWRPFGWSAFHPRCVHYNRPFVVVHTHRVVRAHAVYRPYRVASVSVRSRHATAMGNYRVTRSKTVVTGPRGHGVVRKTTTVRGPGGRVKARHTNVHRRRG